METPQEPVFYTKAQVAERLKVSLRTIERAIAAGQLVGVRIGSRLRFSSVELQRLAEKRP